MDSKHPKTQKMSIRGERESWEPKGGVGRELQLLMSWWRKWVGRSEEGKFLKSSSTWIFEQLAAPVWHGWHWLLATVRMATCSLASGTWQLGSWHLALGTFTHGIRQLGNTGTLLSLDASRLHWHLLGTGLAQKHLRVEICQESFIYGSFQPTPSGS